MVLPLVAPRGQRGAADEQPADLDWLRQFAQETSGQKWASKAIIEKMPQPAGHVSSCRWLRFGLRVRLRVRLRGHEQQGTGNSGSPALVPPADSGNLAVFQWDNMQTMEHVLAQFIVLLHRLARGLPRSTSAGFNESD